MYKFKVLLVLVILGLLVNAANAVTISIKATNNGKYVGVEHYYGVGSNGNYKAEGKGNVNFGGNVHLNENSKCSGRLK